MVTFRLATRTKSRTSYDYWAIETMPENRVEINPSDAADLDIVTGDRVRSFSRSGQAHGIAKISQRVRPCVIAAPTTSGTPRREPTHGTSPAEPSTRLPEAETSIRSCTT